MKVLLVTDEFRHALTGSGGVAKRIASFYDTDFQVEVISEQDHGQKIAGELLPGLGYFIRCRKYRQLVMEKLSSETYDVLLLNDVWFAYGMFFALKRKHWKMAVIAFMHDDNTLTKNAGVSGSLGKQLSLRVRKYLEQRTIPLLDALLTNSKYMQSLLQAEYPAQQVHAIPYAVYDYASIEFRHVAIDPEKEIRVLFMKSDFERGGLRMLIHALRQLHEFTVVLTIAGPEEIALRKALGNVLDENPRLKFHCAGPVPDQDAVINMYRTHHLVCVPSQREALGLVNAEALATGIPVVSVRAGGIPEVLDHGNAGWLAQENSPAALAEAIRNCIIHPEETARKAKHGREYVVRNYPISAFRRALINALHAVRSKAVSQ